MNCRNCGIELVEGVNWWPSSKATRKYVCNDCFQKLNRVNHKRVDALSKQRRVARVRTECIALLDGRCARCGFSDARALCIDHIDGGGSLERRQTNTLTYYKRILENIKSNNCNTIKAIERREYTPHQLYKLEGWQSGRNATVLKTVRCKSLVSSNLTPSAKEVKHG